MAPPFIAKIKVHTPFFNFNLIHYLFAILRPVVYATLGYNPLGHNIFPLIQETLPAFLDPIFSV